MPTLLREIPEAGDYLRMATSICLSLTGRTESFMPPWASSSKAAIMSKLEEELSPWGVWDDECRLPSSYNATTSSAGGTGGSMLPSRGLGVYWSDASDLWDGTAYSEAPPQARDGNGLRLDSGIGMEEEEELVPVPGALEEDVWELLPQQHAPAAPPTPTFLSLAMLARHEARHPEGPTTTYIMVPYLEDGAVDWFSAVSVRPRLAQ